MLLLQNETQWEDQSVHQGFMSRIHSGQFWEQSEFSVTHFPRSIQQSELHSHSFPTGIICARINIKTMLNHHWLATPNRKITHESSAVSSDNVQFLGRTFRTHQRTIKISKKRRRSHVPHSPALITVESDSQQLQPIPQTNPSIEIIDVHKSDSMDDEELEYYKQRLGFVTKKESQVPSQKERSAIPAPIMPPKAKFIYEYPPYILKPGEVWPPKYPNSFQAFKRQMREERKLD